MGSSNLSGSPGTKPNAFSEVPKFITDGLIYDPSYLFKLKSPTVHQIIDGYNRLVVAVTDLQQVATSLTLEGMETRKVCDELKKAINETVMPNLVEIGGNVGVIVTPEKIDFWEWDGNGVLDEGIDPYCCHVQV